MGFWDDIKKLFGAAPSPPLGGVGAIVQGAMIERMTAGQTFSPVNVADSVAKHGLPVSDQREAAAWVEEHFRRALLDRYDYTRSLVRTGDRMVWIYHRVGESPLSAGTVGAGTPVGKGVVVATPAPAIAKTGAAQPKTAPDAPPNPYEGGALMRLSPAELRARALTITPWKTAWIGRVDVIQPASDERTGLVDRGLVLRGFFTEEEIAEIHRVGDLWLEHRDAAGLARARAAKSADEAVAQLQKDAIAKKAEKKKAAADRATKRALEIARRKAEDIVFLGRGVSEQLHDRRANVEALERRALPVLATPGDVARAIGVPIPKLRWLAFHAEASEQGHYVQFEIDKRSGGKRTLSAPKPELRRAQEWVQENVLAALELEDAAHGFVPGRSTVTNARRHQGRDVVVNLDLEDFFPTITFPRVRGFFKSLGYSPCVATILALLTTESPRREVAYDGKLYRVAVGPRALPQGACTSPALSNQVVRKLDRRLTGLAKKHGWTYTRYADDLTFSAPGATDGPGVRDQLGMLLARVRHVVTEEGFRINDKKGRVQRKGGRQTVTGIVVNERHKLGLPREEVRQLRALLHNAKKTGLAAQNKHGHPDFEAHLRGKIAYVAMVDPTRGADLARRLDAAR